MRRSLLFFLFFLGCSSMYAQLQAVKHEKNISPLSTKGKELILKTELNAHSGTSNPTSNRPKGLGGHDCKSHDLTKKYYESLGVWDAFQTDYSESTKKAKPENTVKTPGVNTIAVIFHVVHNPNNPAENVSNALIMQVFNDIQQDFQLLNADASQARSQFGFVPADANINFCLATRTPTGTPLTETGVIRVSTTEDFYDPDNGEENKMKASSTGGSQIWDRNKYMNVWICDISNGANSGTAGYAYRPTNNFLPGASIDGIVLDYNLGMNNDNVLTHEIGHYLGLDHTWGGSGSCSNDDGFTDTPNTAGPSFNFAGSCSGNQVTCTGVQTQYENYMDYSNCTVMFTQAQANFMLSVLTGIRGSLLASPGCDPINAAPVADFNADISAPIIIPVGGSLNFFDLSTNTPTSWTWNFGGGAVNSTQQNPTATFNSVGTYTISLTAANAFGSDNETKTGYVQVVAASTSLACDTLRTYNPVTESYAYYNVTPTPNWGYFPGTSKISNGLIALNQHGDKYTAPASTQVRRLRFPIAVAVNTSGTGKMFIRVHSDNAGSPGTVLVTDTMLIADMDEGYYNEFDFTNPPTVTGNFWVTFEMPYGIPQDSVSLMCVDYNDRINGISTMKTFYSNTWHPPSDIFGATFKTSLWLDVLTSNGPAPVADFTYSESAICAGGQVVVNGAGSTNTTNYYWYVTDDPFTTILSTSSSGANVFTFPAAQNRRIYLFADGSCRTDGIYLPVDINAKPTATLTATPSTCGVNNGVLTFTNPSGGHPPYSYSKDGVNFQTGTTFTGLPAWTYAAKIKTNGSGCINTYTQTVGASSELNATISPSLTICPGESTTLTAGGGTSYNWFDGSTSIGTGSSIAVTPTATNQYTCVISDGTCQASLYTYVYVDNCGSLTESALNAKIYPNPTNNEVNIEFPSTFSYTLHDSRGRLVANGSATNNTLLQLAQMDKGMYLLHLISSSHSGTYRIVKQ
jgi:PKD repeat protein